MTSTLTPTQTTVPETSHGFNLRGLLERVNETAVKSGKAAAKVTKKVRRTVWSGPYTADQRDQLHGIMELNEQLIARYVASEDRLPTAFDVDVKVSEWQAMNALQEVLEGRLAATKAEAFNWMNLDLVKNHGVDPEEVGHTPHRMVAPDNGMAIVRERGGRQEPTLDLEMLKFLDPELAEALTVKVVIEEHTVVVPEEVIETVDIDLAMDVLRRDPSKIEVLRQVMKDGAPKPTAMTLRPATDEEIEEARRGFRVE